MESETTLNLLRRNRQQQQHLKSSPSPTHPSLNRTTSLISSKATLSSNCRQMREDIFARFRAEHHLDRRLLSPLARNVADA